MSNDLQQFVKRFLTGRINWWKVPRSGAIINYGSIISLCLYRKAPFQVELFIVPYAPSSFTNHRHPHVDSYEFPLSGDHTLFFDSEPCYSKEAMEAWVKGIYNCEALSIPSTQYHSGVGRTPYAFLSMQQWPHGVEPISVGYDWEGLPSSTVHATLLTEATAHG